MTSRDSPATTTPAKRQRPRVAPSGDSLPALVRLRAQKVSQKTLDSYFRHIGDFEKWAKLRRLRVSSNSLDKHVTRYITELSEDEDFSPNTGAYLIYGLQLLRCTIPKKDYLPNAKEALAGWRKQAPGRMRLPVPEEFVFDMVTLALEVDALDVAMAILIQYDTYLRPSECLGLTLKHLGAPHGPRYKHWAIVVAPSALGEVTKTGDSDDSVLLAELGDRDWLREAMTLWVSRCSGPLFPKLSLSRFEAWCRSACRKLQYKSVCIMPHILRHSGASNDVFHKRRDLLHVQKRGRWQAKKSVTRYEKHPLLQKRWDEADPARLASIRSRSQQLPKLLLEQLRHTG